MGRPLYPYELTDADFSWLMNTFQEHNPNYIVVETSCLPVVLLPAKLELRTSPDEVPPETEDAELDGIKK